MSPPSPQPPHQRAFTAPSSPDVQPLPFHRRFLSRLGLGRNTRRTNWNAQLPLRQPPEQPTISPDYRHVWPTVLNLSATPPPPPGEEATQSNEALLVQGYQLNTAERTIASVVKIVMKPLGWIYGKLQDIEAKIETRALARNPYALDLEVVSSGSSPSRSK